MIGIYKITNLINNKVYIGQSRNIQARFNAHKRRPFDIVDEDYEKVLYRAIRKYGLENFSFEVIEQCPIEKLNERENYWIKYFNSTNNAFGYNQTIGDYNLAPQKMTEEKLLLIIKDLQENILPIKEIANKFGFHSNMITNINQGHSWRQNNISYPIRKPHKKTKYYCSICGKQISTKAKFCVECGHMQQRVVERPERETLKNLIRIMPFTQIAKKYNVTDNTIRKWCDRYNLPRRKKDIDAYSDEEWVNI